MLNIINVLFLIQNVLVDLSISFLQIKHLNIGDIFEKLKKNIYFRIFLKIKVFLNSFKIYYKLKFHSKLF